MLERVSHEGPQPVGVISVRAPKQIGICLWSYRMLEIRPALDGDRAAIWSIIGPVIRAGETYTLPVDMTENEAVRYWTGPDRHSFVGEDDGVPVGTYYLRANQAGGGSHVANCRYMTDAAARLRGVARAMCEHSLGEARRLGFLAMQFNLSSAPTSAPSGPGFPWISMPWAARLPSTDRRVGRRARDVQDALIDAIQQRSRSLRRRFPGTSRTHRPCARRQTSRRCRTGSRQRHRAPGRRCTP